MAEVDFVRDVQPILRKRCLGCHGAVRPQSGLRLDNRTHAIEGGYSGVVLKPGDSAGSKLYRVVAGKDTLTMPPGGAKLPQAEVDLIRTWIDEGALWPSTPSAVPATAATKLWSFQPLQKPALPDSTLHPIDAFVLARLRKRNIEPSPEAPRHTLLRRLYLDLTGLPPTSEDVARQEPYQTTVDRLLSSPHFGEKCPAAGAPQRPPGPARQSGLRPHQV